MRLSITLALLLGLAAPTALWAQQSEPISTTPDGNKDPEKKQEQEQEDWDQEWEGFMSIPYKRDRTSHTGPPSLWVERWTGLGSAPGATPGSRDTSSASPPCRGGWKVPFRSRACMEST